ncbi:hypothetical protein DL89DRAFT_301748 [Linderina pennispora]|uniref:ABC transmembrane type-1 domain-containing protein n=1 Tax=Linderina pennispora TaxID=61395 RepID=A0A1Y1W4N4_9FUNG|nr:uncharacterized protein DL89DRAFT_301748 [Linderina pennispora]ORX68196.1 hypothetical protein DL89DRAFT_301748 [Linderina pennispora]
MLMRVLHIHHSAFRQRVKVQVGNALHLAVCRRSILETGSTHTLQSLLDERKVLLDAYVDSIFLLLNKLGPTIRLIGDIMLTYSVVGWRIVVLFGTILALTAVSEAISGVYKQRRLDRKRPRTLHTRITEMLPSILAIKLNSWESAFLSLLPGDNYDDRGTGFLKVLAAAVRRMTKEAAVLLALSVFPIPAMRLSNADIIRLIMSLKSAGSSCGELFQNVSQIAEIFRLERLIQGRLRQKRSVATTEISRYQKGGPRVVMNNASFAWFGQAEPALHMSSISIQDGELVAVTGQVGSGKSALLLAILGEMQLDERK